MKTIRYIAEALLILILFALFKLLSTDMSSRFGGAMGRIIGVRLAASRKAICNINHALPDVNSHEVCAGMWANLGRAMAEYPHLSYIAKNRVNVRGEEHLKTAIDAGKGAIFISAHFGNWEVISATIRERYNDDVNITYRAPNNPVADKILSHARTLGGRVQAHNKSREGGRAMMKVLKRGGLLGILIDQKYNEGVEADFFGHPAMTNPVFVQFAKKYNVPLIPVCCTRKDGAHFDIHFEAPLDTSGDIDSVIKAAHTRLEDWITQEPEQWLWLHRRWKDF